MRTAAGGEPGHRQGEGRWEVPGKPEKVDRDEGILKMLKNGQSWNSIIAATGVSRSTLARLAKRLPQQTTLDL